MPPQAASKAVAKDGAEFETPSKPLQAESETPFEPPAAWRPMSGYQFQNYGPSLYIFICLHLYIHACVFLHY